MDAQSDCEVLVVGAGPTGLVLALWLTRHGIRVRIVDKATQAGTTSRALVVHARTLEEYQAFGIAQDVLAASRKFVAVNLWVEGRKRARAPFGDFGRGLSPFPYAVIYPQDEHEKMLEAKLREYGVRVERGVEAVSFEEDREHYVATRLRRADGGESRCRSAFLAGCDGAHSFVRESIHAGFPGGTYSHLFYVADVRAAGPVADGELHVALDRADFLGIFPLKADGHLRLVGTVDENAAREHGKLRWEDVSGEILKAMRIDVQEVHWFSTYHVHHRVARCFREGRVFLLGDAAHIHSPVGAQGMNTGIGDAVNLAWKLAAVLRGRAAERLLDTYEIERIAFARRLVESTDEAFVFATRDGPIARFVRLHVVPALIPAAFRREFMLRFMFRTLSQVNIQYRMSPMSGGRAGGLHAGDRLPWAGENFAPLATLDWQVHVYGATRPGLAELCDRRGIALHEFGWDEEAQAAGFGRDALYLVRPDGYIAWADATALPARLAAYLDAWDAKPLHTPAGRSDSPGAMMRAAGS